MNKLELEELRCVQGILENLMRGKVGCAHNACYEIATCLIELASDDFEAISIEPRCELHAGPGLTRAPLDDWRWRLVQENNELSARIDRLSAFMSAEERNSTTKVTPSQFVLLRNQARAMIEYQEAIGARLLDARMAIVVCDSTK